MVKSILVTGGAGYIGSHTVKQLIKRNHSVVVIDNLSRGHIESIPDNVKFLNCDLLNYNKLNELISTENIESIIHFAAFAYVGESVEKPSIYYENNVIGSFNLLKAAINNNIKKFVFSSTCSLYGNPDIVLISEMESVKPINPYANTKFCVEKIINDFETAYGLKSVILRYFNAAGADFESEIGESHNPETHLIPLVLDVALGKRDKIKVFGNDYNTPDGTCVRDYIHVNDLADAHIKALEYLETNNKSNIFNLGTGDGYSVMEIINSAERITNKTIPYQIVTRRPGDPDILVADNKKAKEVLNWENKSNLDDIILSAYNWHKIQRY